MGYEYKVESAALTHPGRKRHHNEDFVAFYEPDSAHELQYSGRLYIVADGVGGAAKGEVASQYAAQKVLYDYYENAGVDINMRLRQALQQAGNDIYQHSRAGSFRPMKMATTMVAAVIRGTTLTVANVGDSRAYLLRNGNVQQVTWDHTIAGELVQAGEITEEEALEFPGKNSIMRSLGGERDVQVDMFVNIDLYPGDRILLCSDGLARYTSRRDIAALASQGSPREVVEQCIEYANQRGGVDNITAILVEVGEAVSAEVASAYHSSTALPIAVDFETFETTPPTFTSASAGKRSNLLSTLSTKQIVVATGALSTLALLALGIYLVGFGNRAAREVAAEVSPAPTETAHPVLLPSATLALPTPSGAAILVDSAPATATLVPTAMPTSPVSQEIPDTPAANAEQDGLSQAQCYYRVVADDYSGMAQLAAKFGLGRESWQQFRGVYESSLEEFELYEDSNGDPIIPEVGTILRIPVSQERCHPHGTWTVLPLRDH